MMDDATLERVVAEYADLSAKLDRLGRFILTDKFEDLPEVDRRDLREQRGHMLAYEAVLERRLERQVTPLD